MQTKNDLEIVCDYETACKNAQELANLLKRQSVVIWQSKGLWCAMGRKEYYYSQPADPRKRRTPAAFYAPNTACTGLAPTAAQDKQGSTGASQ